MSGEGSHKSENQGLRMTSTTLLIMAKTHLLLLKPPVRGQGEIDRGPIVGHLEYTKCILNMNNLFIEVFICKFPPPHIPRAQVRFWAPP